MASVSTALRAYVEIQRVKCSLVTGVRERKDSQREQHTGKPCSRRAHDNGTGQRRTGKEGQGSAGKEIELFPESHGRSGEELKRVILLG
jgi:hypothetical protein